MATATTTPAAAGAADQAHLRHIPVDILVHAYNSKCLAANTLLPSGPDFAELYDGDGDEDKDKARPRTFLHAPASEEAIAALDARVRAHGFPAGLPADVAALYRATDGIYAPGGDGDGNDEIFRPAALVEMVDDAEWPCELLPLPGADVDIEWPDIAKAVQLGAGGDEGMQLLVPPATTAEAIRVAEEAWKNADEKARAEMEKVAGKIYGGWDEMKKLEVAVIRTYHWATETEVFANFQHLLLDGYVMADAKDGKDEDEDEDEENEDEEGGEDGGDGADEDGDETEPEEVEGGDDEETEDDEEPKPKKGRKAAPKSKRSALDNVKLIFTGTFKTMDRKTCEQTAKQHGGQLTRKLADADYIVLGERAGPKKIEEIKKLGLTTINEQQFLKLLEGEDPGEGQAPAPTPAPVAKAVKAQPKAKSKSSASMGSVESLEGKKILFTGTLETMDRKKSKETAEKHGAKVITKLENTDFIVLGINAGPKKLEEIEKKGLRTVTEQEFLAMTEAGGGSEDAATSGTKRAQKDSAPKRATKRQRGGK